VSGKIGWLAALLFTAGCVSNHPDHFYTLDPVPRTEGVPRASFATQISLRVTLPSLVDRNEWVLRNGTGVTVLEHERRAAPLADQVTTVLGQDFEQRRPELLITSRQVAPPGVPLIAVSVDIVELSLGAGDAVTLEARWQVVRTTEGRVASGRDTFRQTASGDTYPAKARALSACIAQMAERLIQEFPPSSAGQP
jgi:uncharacterized lipoprotein YmbA